MEPGGYKGRGRERERKEGKEGKGREGKEEEAVHPQRFSKLAPMPVALAIACKKNRHLIRK